MTDDKKSKQDGQKAGKPGTGATDEAKSPASSASAPATPNRDRGREAPIIDARPGDVREAGKPGTPPAGTGKADAVKDDKALQDDKASQEDKTKQDDKAKPAVVAGAAGGALTGATAAAPSTGASAAKPSPAASASGGAPSGTGAPSASAGGKPPGATPGGAPGTGGPSGSGGGSGSKPPSSSPASSPAPAKPESGKSGGGAGLAAAALAGAAIALLAGWGFYTYNDIGGSLGRVNSLSQAQQNAAGDQDKKLASVSEKLTKEQEARIAGLTKRLAALEAAAKQAATEAGEAKAAVAKLSSAATRQPPGEKVDLSPLEKRIAAIEESLAAPKSDVRATGDRANVPAQAGASGTGAETGKSAATQISGKQIADLQARVDALAKQAAAAVKPGTLDERISAVEKKITPPVDIAPVEKRIAELEKELGGKIAPIASATQTNSKQIADTTARLSASVDKANAAATAVVARTLYEQVNGGESFARILGAVEALGANDSNVAKLKPHAEKGLPTDAELAKRFDALSGKLLTPAKPKQDASFMDRLKAGASSLVTVRPVGETSSDAPGALVTRIGRALHGGNSAEALALFDKLPDAAKARADEFATALRNRVEAKQAVQAILDNALGKLGQSKS